VPIVLSNADLAGLLDFRECLPAFEDAYRELAASAAVNRPTTQTYLRHSLPRTTYCFKSVEGGISGFGVLALRLSSDILKEEVIDGRLRLNKLPLAGTGLYVGLVLLFSVETGELLAIMPDGFMQQVRVALTSALGVRCLARPESATLGLIGTGDQARAHLRVLIEVRPITQVKVFSPNASHRETFAETMQREHGVAVRAVGSVEQAVADCDIVCTATNSSRPILRAKHLQPGMHYNAIREFELDESVFDASDVIAIHTRFGGAHHYMPPGQTEDFPGLRREKARDWGRFPELSDLLSGAAPGRTDPRQITFFLNNIGTGLQFAALGFVAWRAARERGVGQEAPAAWFLQDIKP
jgi:ornithine cyclodeaminase/alanine dehydrogenase-like protein (mu-crystallin family)